MGFNSGNQFRIAGILLILETIALLYFSIVPYASIDTGIEALRLGDFEHLMAYLIYALLAERVLSQTKFKKHRVILAFLIAAAFGGINEVIQSFIPLREADMIDLAFDTVGSVIGSFLLGLKK
ncbi:MAG: VanZ family protein [Candidatus Aenigmatarchaeota archaeon]